MHGPTYMANPLATAVALASLDLLERGDWRGAVAGIEAVMAQELQAAARLDGVREVRTLGAIAVIETEHEVALTSATAAAVEAGVWLRPFRNLIYAMPPYVATEEELRTIARAMVAAAEVSVEAAALSP
jgi:adenosylmethionine-8-amino-7-oxononanoate aminotransferase